MKKHLCGGLLLLAASCTAPDDFVGDDVGYLDDRAFGDGAPESDADPSTLTGLLLSDFEAACDPNTLAEPMTLQAAGDTTGIGVVHAGIDAHCDLDPSALAMLNADGLSGERPLIEVYYTDNAASQATDCVCGWTLSYRISGLDAGEYDITAAGSTAVATIGGTP